MNSENQNKIGAGKLSRFERIEKVPLLKMLLYLSMAGMGVLFFILIFIFLSDLGQLPPGKSIALPKLFSVSTVLLLVSGFFMHQVPDFYKQDDLVRMNRRLLGALSLGVLFTVAQVVAWYELTTQQVFFKGQTIGTFLYLLSALHLLHVAGGLAFLAFLFLKNNRASKDPIRTLVFIRDPFRKMQLEMLRSYWHFLDAVWIGLYFVFLFAL
ncbi:cytochrome c oxidase subunit III [Rufibacter sp. LB8]|uniref:cytochrome c oxidase subunit 3 n=1 Tax=Rufibacter sp. LB8 TaxID=2777781 RepID=UPI00178C37F1|nr:cytochrome c oxidase subunit III [Rufibacter sp. LB8]